MKRVQFFKFISLITVVLIGNHYAIARTTECPPVDIIKNVNFDRAVFDDVYQTWHYVQTIPIPYQGNWTIYYTTHLSHAGKNTIDPVGEGRKAYAKAIIKNPHPELQVIGDASSFFFRCVYADEPENIEAWKFHGEHYPD